VRSAGVVVGRVTSIGLDPKTFQGVVTMEIDSSVVFPKDSSAKILTAGLLGDQYIGIEAGVDDKNLAAGDTIRQTQSAGGAGEPDRPARHEQGRRGGHDAVAQVRHPESPRLPVALARPRWVAGAVLLALTAPAAVLAEGPGPGAGEHGERRRTWPADVAAPAAAAAPTPAARPRVRQDPLEPLNRGIFAFNDAVDARAAAARGARCTARPVPELVRTGCATCSATSRTPGRPSTTCCRARVGTPTR
jgi:hypothetical protein